MLFNVRMPFLPVAILVVLLSSGCGLLGGGDDGTDVRVLEAVMSTDITPDQQATAYTTRAFPEGTSRVYAVLALVGAAIGDELTGRWYELSADGAGPDGAFVNEGSVVLSQDTRGRDGIARISFTLTSNTASLPKGDWALRVYANDDHIRTMAFVISSFVTLPAAQQTGNGAAEGPGPTGTLQQDQPAPTQELQQTEATATPVPQAQPTGTPSEQPQTYTVQSGDTLTVIAERFKSPDDSTDSYVARLMELNNLTSDSILFVDQTLTLPGPP